MNGGVQLHFISELACVLFKRPCHSGKEKSIVAYIMPQRNYLNQCEAECLQYEFLNEMLLKAIVMIADCCIPGTWNSQGAGRGFFKKAT